MIIDLKIKDITNLSCKECLLLSQKMEFFCISNKISSLSANEVGINCNFFIYTLDNKNYKYMLNCEYKPINDEKFLSIESCYSIMKNQKRYEVSRYKSLQVQGKEFLLNDFKIIEFSRQFDSRLESCIFQHEIDHYYNKSINETGKEIYIQERIKI